MAPTFRRGRVLLMSSIFRTLFGKRNSEGLAGQLRSWVGEQIGPIARPRDVYIVGELPKTQTGKIRRRELRDEHTPSHSSTPTEGN